MMKKNKILLLKVCKSSIFLFIFCMFCWGVCTTTFEAAESVNVRYFFPKWDTQNPSANPNCFYYWCQTGANNGHGNISYCSSTIHDGVATAGFFDPATPNLIYVCGKRTDEAGHRDIMYFSKTVIHEGLHRTHYNQTHGVGASPDADGDWLHDGLETCDDLNLNGVRDHEPYTDSNDNGQYDYGEPFEDIGLIRMELTLAEFRSGIPARAVRYGDGNGSWDQEGPNMNGTSRYHANTRGGLYDDEDDTCYAIEANAANASNEDWSKPGQQW